MFKPLALAATATLATPAFADVMQCTGSHPNWRAELNGDTATFTLRERTGDYAIKLVTPAKNDPDTTAYTLIGTTDTAILIVSASRCNTSDYTANVLTQERAEAILLTSCCTLPPE